MLRLVAEQAQELATLMQSPGGFAWWYVDLMDEHGRGLVLLWSFGLPFLPGSRRLPRPAHRPSVSLALYEHGRNTFYLLQTYAAEQATVAGPGLFRLGDSWFELRADSESTRLNAALDLQLPTGGRMTGAVEARGATCRLEREDGRASTHRWAPILAAARGSAQLSHGPGTRFELVGRAYVDSNGSQEPLHALGIDSWRWGRVAFPDHELIYYLVDSAHADSLDIQWVLEVFADGRVRSHRAELCWQAARRSVYGLSWHEELRLFSASGLDATLRLSRPVDDGPFYQRFLLVAQNGHGQRGRGFAEQVCPERVDNPWQRPFVRMRTHATDARNSIWLPLFSGPQKGRLARLFAHWLRSKGPEETAA
jgi:carotenoid 1,2-hydratase